MQQASKLEKYVLSIPPLFYLVLLFLIPSLIMILVAFRTPGDYGGVMPLVQHGSLSLSLTSFTYALTNGFIWLLFIRSMLIALLVTLICLLVAYPLALLIASSPKKYRDFLLLLVIIPFWSNFLIRVYAWMIILGPNSAVSNGLNYIRDLFGLPAVDLLYSSAAVIICLVYINLPFMILPLYANLEKHDLAMLEASRDLGATRFKAFCQITLPLSLPGILAGSALVFIPSIGMFVVPELVGSNCSLMIGNLIKQQFLQTMNWPLGSVTAIIMTLCVIGLSVMVGAGAKRLGGLKYASK